MQPFTAEGLIRLAGHALASLDISREKLETLGVIVLPPEECNILIASSHETIADWEARITDRAISIDDPPADALEDPRAEACIDLEGELVTLVCVRRGDVFMRLGYSPSRNAIVIPDVGGTEEG